MSWEIKIALGAELRVCEWERQDWKLYHEHYWYLGLVIPHCGGGLPPALLKYISIPSLSPLGVSSILPAVTATERKKICPTRQNWFENHGKTGTKFWAMSLERDKGLNHTEKEMQTEAESRRSRLHRSRICTCGPKKLPEWPRTPPCKRPNVTTFVCLLLTVMLVSLCPAVDFHTYVCIR